MIGQTGTVLGGRYRLGEPVARGGMGTVWRATDLVLDREVAIKMLALRFQDDPDGSARFRREARVLARLSDPRLGGVHDYGEEDGRAYMVMEFLTGETLLHLLSRVDRIAAAEAAEIAAQVAEGLHAAHQADIIHRDVKPANIIVTEDGVKLVDFGIALGAGDDRLTATGTLIGSATYLAPERGAGWPATPASDLYSLAVVLYQMLAGRPPYTGTDPVDLVAAHSAARPPPLPADVPGGLAVCCSRAMAKHPAKRPESALAFATMLRASTRRGRHAASAAAALPRDSGLTGPSEDGPPTASLPVAHTWVAKPWRRRRGWIAAAALAAALATVIAVTLLITTSGGPGHPAARARATAQAGHGRPASGSSPPASGPPAATWLVTAGPPADSHGSPPPSLIAPAGTTVLLVQALRNAGRQPINHATLGLSVPSGWTVTPQTPTTTGVIRAGGTATVTWRVGVPAGTHPGQFPLVATARCAAPTPCGAVSGSAVVPYSSFSQAFDNVGTASQAASAAANLDGTGQSYQREALAAAGYLPGAQVSHDGISFAWPEHTSTVPRASRRLLARRWRCTSPLPRRSQARPCRRSRCLRARRRPAAWHACTCSPSPSADTARCDPRRTRPGGAPMIVCRLSRVVREIVWGELDQAAFVGEMDACLAVYAAAMNPPAEQLPGRRAIMARHVRYPQFRCLAAYLGSAPARVVAFAYGFHGAPGQWWHDLVASAVTVALGEPRARHWIADSFEIGEVHVHPDYQGRGIGREMVLALTAGRAERTAVLSTRDADSRARRLYRKLGFADLLTSFCFPGGPERYAVMGAELPLRAG